MTKGATAAVGRPGSLTFGIAAVAALAFWAASLSGVLLLGEGTWRAGLIAGVVCGGFGGIAGLALLAFTRNSGPHVALSARLVGFMFRIGLIAIGLLATIKAFHAEPLGFVFAFFPLFFVFTGLEHLVSLSALTAPAPRSDG